MLCQSLIQSVSFGLETLWRICRSDVTQDEADWTVARITTLSVLID